MVDTPFRGSTEQRSVGYRTKKWPDQCKMTILECLFWEPGIPIETRFYMFLLMLVGSGKGKRMTSVNLINHIRI